MFPFNDPSLPLGIRIVDLLSRLSAEEKIALLPTRQAAVSRLGINAFNIGGEGAHGVVMREGDAATVFPQPIALSCTWDTELMEKIGCCIGDEARVFHQRHGRNGFLMLWFPTIDLCRDPRWGRTEEGYGEDPFLAGKLAAALIRGSQGYDSFYVKIAAAPKHFYANNTEKNRMTYSVSLNKRNKYEYYTKPFSYAYKEGGALSMMTAYNEINGRPCILLDELNELVKGEWGCAGPIVCDGGDFSQTVISHEYVKSHAVSLMASLRAGIDAFTDSGALVIESAREALKENLITESDIDRALTNVFKVRFRLGEFDKEHPYKNIPEDKLLCREHKELSLEAAKKAVVLLKNDGFLPLSINTEKILVVGGIAGELYPGWYEGECNERSTFLKALTDALPDAKILHESCRDTVSFFDDSTGYIAVGEDGQITNEAAFTERSLFYEYDWGFGCYSYQCVHTGKYLTVVRTEPQGDAAEPSASPGALEVTADRVFGWFTMELFYYNGDDFYHKGSDTVWKKNYEYDAFPVMLDKAEQADIVLINFGNHPLANGRECLDRPDIVLPARERRIIEKIADVNKNICLVLTAGYPYAIEREAELARAVLYSGQGSQSLGKALVACVLGEYSPAGRLSMSWYKSTADLPCMTDYDIINKRTYMYTKNALYPFGHGLSYCSFDYWGLKIEKDKLEQEDTLITIKFSVTNKGEYNADEVAQVYVSMKNPSVPRPRRQLVGFSRVNLSPAKSEQIEISFNRAELAYYDTVSGRMRVETGFYNIYAGASSMDIRLTGEFYVKGSERGLRDMRYISAFDYDESENIIIKEDEYRTTVVAGEPEGAIEFFDCGFTGYEKRVHVRFGASDGYAELYADDVFIAKIHAKAAVTEVSAPPPHAPNDIMEAAPSFSGAENIMIENTPKRLKVKLFDGCAVRDICFESE